MLEKEDFWEEICGTVAFKRLGLKKVTPDSLAIFDAWYFDHYPYLKKYFSKNELKDKTVLEIGLGFGSVGEYLAMNSEEYVGVDLAKTPVKLMKKEYVLNNSKRLRLEMQMLSIYHFLKIILILLSPWVVFTIHQVCINP